MPLNDFVAVSLAAFIVFAAITLWVREMRR